MYIDINRYDIDYLKGDIISEVKASLITSGKSRFSKKHSVATCVILSNMSLLTEHDKAIVMSFSNDSSIPLRYNVLGLKRRVLSDVSNALEHCGYVSIVKGVKNKACTVLKPTDKFYKVFPFEPKYISSNIEYIILRNRDKTLKDYKDDKFTRMARVVVDRYNAVLANTYVTFDGNRLSNTYYRIFNEDFQSGGRYYKASVLSLSGADRLKLQIDNKPVCEVDFSCMHISILLGLSGKHLTYDPYGFTEDRSVAKKVLNIVLCSSDRRSACKAVQQEINKGDIMCQEDAKTLLGAAESLNECVSHHFYKGGGLNAMFHESEIATDVISTMLSMDTPVLVIHDGFVCQQVHKNVLLQVMLDAFTSHVKHNIPMFVSHSNIDGVDEKLCVMYDDCCVSNSLPVDSTIYFNKQYCNDGNRRYEM